MFVCPKPRVDCAHRSHRCYFWLQTLPYPTTPLQRILMPLNSNTAHRRGNGCFVGGFAVHRLLLGFSGRDFQPVSLTCSHTSSCHVCSSCEERLHAALAPRAVTRHRGCATCEHWLRAQPGTPRTYRVPSIEETHSPAETRYLRWFAWKQVHFLCTVRNLSFSHLARSSFGLSLRTSR